MFLAVIYVIGLLSNYLQAFLFTTAIQRFSERLRRAIAEKINSLPLGYFDGHSQGDTLSRVTNDVDTAAQSLNQSLGTVLSSTLLVVAVLVTMFGMNWILALVTVVSTLIGFAFVSVFMGKSQGFFKSQQQDLAAVNVIRHTRQGISLRMSIKIPQWKTINFLCNRSSQTF